MDEEIRRQAEAAFREHAPKEATFRAAAPTSLGTVLALQSSWSMTVNGQRYTSSVSEGMLGEGPMERRFIDSCRHLGKHCAAVIGRALNGNA